MVCSGLIHEAMACSGLIHEGIEVCSGLIHEAMACSGLIHEGIEVCSGLIHAGMACSGLIHEGIEVCSGLIHAGMACTFSPTPYRVYRFTSEIIIKGSFYMHSAMTFHLYNSITCRTCYNFLKQANFNTSRSPFINNNYD